MRVVPQTTDVKQNASNHNATLNSWTLNYRDYKLFARDGLVFCSNAPHAPRCRKLTLT